jgi:hypothetical protein
MLSMVNWNEWVETVFWIFIEGLRKTTKVLSKNYLCFQEISNRVLPAWKSSGLVFVELTCKASFVQVFVIDTDDSSTRSMPALVIAMQDNFR